MLHQAEFEKCWYPETPLDGACISQDWNEYGTLTEMIAIPFCQSCSWAVIQGGSGGGKERGVTEHTENRFCFAELF